MCIRDRPRWALISSKRARVRLLSCSRWRNFNSVVASGTDWRDRSMPTKSRSAWLSYSASSSASSARPYHCCRQYMRSMVGTPIGWRPTRPLVGYSGSMTAISRAHGTMRSISPRNFSRRVRFFFIAYSALAKLRCDIGVLSLDSVLLRMHAPCRVRRIDQQFLRELVALGAFLFWLHCQIVARFDLTRLTRADQAIDSISLGAARDAHRFWQRSGNGPPVAA